MKKMHKLRVIFDRRTGEEIGREVIGTYEVTDDEYSDSLVRVMTGMSPERAAKRIKEAMMAEQYAT